MPNLTTHLVGGQAMEGYGSTTTHYTPATQTPKSWQGMVFGGSANNIEFNFTVNNSTCDSYGIILSNPVNNVTLNDLAHIIVIEPSKNRLYLTDYLWDFQNCRSYNFEKREKV